MLNSQDLSKLTQKSQTRYKLDEDPQKPNKHSQTIRYSSYAGTDIVAEVILPGSGKITLGELQTISYSIHRENVPVRVIGHVNPIGFLKGPRTIAGTLIFTTFDQYSFYRLDLFKKNISNALYPLADMLPPFDIVITFANEYGMESKMKIMGVTIVDEGGTMSVDDLMTEQTYQYMARGIQPMVRAQNLLPRLIPADITDSGQEDTKVVRF